MDQSKPLTDGEGIPAQTTIHNEDFETVALVSGVGEQVQSRRYAKDLYTSEYFARKRECAELIDNWTMISAKYGSISPTAAYIEPYAITFDDYPLDPDEHPDLRYETLDAMADDYLSGLENRIHNYERWERYDSFGRLVLLIEDDFLASLREGVLDLADEYDFEVVMPFEGMTDADERMALLAQWAEQAESPSSNPAASETNGEAAPDESEESTDQADGSTDDQANLGAWS